MIQRLIVEGEFAKSTCDCSRGFREHQIALRSTIHKGHTAGERVLICQINIALAPHSELLQRRRLEAQQWKDPHGVTVGEAENQLLLQTHCTAGDSVDHYLVRFDTS